MTHDLTTVGKSGEFGMLLAGKCWYLEGNFGIWREIVPICTQKYINCVYWLAYREINIFSSGGWPFTHSTMLIKLIMVLLYAIMKDIPTNLQVSSVTYDPWPDLSPSVPYQQNTSWYYFVLLWKTYQLIYKCVKWPMTHDLTLSPSVPYQQNT